MVRRNLRRLELAAGAPRRKSGPQGDAVWNTDADGRERRLAEQAERAYEHLVADWKAARARAGAGATPGARIVAAFNEAKPRGRSGAPQGPALRFRQSPAPTGRMPQCSTGKAAKAVTSGAASSSSAATCGKPSASCSITRVSWAWTSSAEGCAKTVRTMVATNGCALFGTRQSTSAHEVGGRHLAAAHRLRS